MPSFKERSPFLLRNGASQEEGPLTFLLMKKKEMDPSSSNPGVACSTEYDKEKVKQYSTSLPFYPRQRGKISITLIK